jgi:pyrroloquinoline quinone biosynthesis protein D
MTDPIAATDVVDISPKFRLQWEEAQGCHVLLYPEGMVKLNPSAGEILKRCDGTKTVAEIIAALSAEFPGVASLTDDVTGFLNTAHDKQWIQRKPA